MLYLQFLADGARYLLPTSCVIEVTPLVPLKKLPKAPACVSGLMNYRGRSLPVIDASQLLAGHPATSYLSSRIVVVKVALPGQAERDIGLLLEKATEVLKMEEERFTEAGIENPQTPYLGEVAMDSRGGMLQRIFPHRLLSETDARQLFSAAEN